MVSEESIRFAKEIFNADSQIVHLGVLDLEGNILLDQSSAATSPSEPDSDRVQFYKQLGLRRNTREHFDEAYGKTNYIHITREKMQQLILYLSDATIYATLEKSMTPEEVKGVAQKIKFLHSSIMKNGV